MKKSFISAVAAITVLSSGAYAFESLTDGTLVTSKTIGLVAGDWFPTEQNTDKSSFTTINQDISATALKASENTNGDMLIYPAYSIKPGFKTQIVVRNTKLDKAVIAKVVLYSADSTRELVDFNIYLSAADAFRFDINEDGSITTMDDSIPSSVTIPHLALGNEGKTFGEKPDQTTFEDKVTMNQYGKKLEITNPTAPYNLKSVGAQTGYVVVYAMAASTDNSGYHEKHADLVKDYRQALDTARPKWRVLSQDNTKFKNGMFVAGSEVIVAPSLNPTAKFKDPDKDIITGTVNIIRKTPGFESDMLLPAKAYSNYTDGNIMMWTEGEYAAIQDRCMTAGVKYKVDCVKADAEANVIKTGMYTYKAGTANALLITQPWKRILVQLGDPDKYYTVSKRFGYVAGIDWPYKSFKLDQKVYDEKEMTYNVASTTQTGVITSPYNPDPSIDPVYYTEEFQAINDRAGKLLDKNHKQTDQVLPAGLQNDPQLNGTFKDASGHSYVNLGEASKGIPAIATQWVGSVVNGKSQSNWIYAPIF